MRPRQFTRRSRRKGSTGLTLIEMLVTMLIASVIMTNGEFYTVAGNTPTTLSLNEPLDGDHPIGTGVYAIDERVYSVTGDDLTLSIDGGIPCPLVEGY